MIPARFFEPRLVRAARAGDAAGVEALVLRYQRKAYAVARAITAGSTAEPADVVEEAFLQALRDLPRLRRPECFGRWFLQIVRNVARRARRRRPITLVPIGPETEASRPPESPEQAETRRRLWREGGRLPEGIREAVFLYYHEGESVRAVAGALGISVAAAKKRLQNGREILREPLWRRLGDTLRQVVPEARARKPSARRLTLLHLAALPARGAAAASAGPAGGGTTTPVRDSAGTPAAPPAIPVSSALITGGILMAVTAAVVLGLGMACWLL